MAATDAPLAAICRAWSQLRPPLSPEELLVTIGPWLFTYRFYERPEPLEGVLQLVRGNPFPQSPAGYQRQCAAILGHDAAVRLGALRVPTHVIVGTEDVLTPPRYSRELAELIPDARLTEIPAAGHGFFWECVPQFNEALIGFLG
jgi:pimeloyl-ACP methyl ester carboxylesterase